MSETSDILTLTHVTKEYPSGDHVLQVLKGANLSIRSGETIAIVGPSGSGKSTLLGLLAGLDRVTSGTIEFEGQAIHAWDEDQLAQWRRKHVGFVFQDFRLIPSFTALENVALPMEILGVDANEANQKAEELLTKLGLGQRTHHFPHQLSGGEQQRVAIARAYVHQPEIIFADEPTGNLDPKTSGSILDSLFSLHKNQKTTLVLVTHDLDIAKLMQRQVRIEDGTCVVTDNQKGGTA